MCEKRRVIYVCHGVADRTFEEAVARATELSEKLVGNGSLPVSSIRMLNGLLTTEQAKEWRESIMGLCFSLIDGCDAILVDNSSPLTAGMLDELAYAQEKGKEIYYVVKSDYLDVAKGV